MPIAGDSGAYARFIGTIVGKPFVRQKGSNPSDGVIQRVEFLGDGSTAALYSPTRKICTINCHMEHKHGEDDSYVEITRREGDILTIMTPRAAAL